MIRPLDGILVVSLEQAIAAPYCTRLLADLGARVIKIERPDGGDFARVYDQRARGLASHFVWCNRSKESVVLDLKEKAGIAALTGLLGSADVLVQNLAPGALARLGVDLARLRSENRRLITCTISGYGAGGPWSDRKAYDLLIQAEAGFLSVTGTPDQVAKSGLSIADIASGVTAHSAILAALLRRERTGEGDDIDVSMLEAMAEWMGYPLYYAMDGAPPPPRAGAGHATIYPYGPYATKDGTVLFGLQNNREWLNFCTHVLERADLGKDPRFASNAGRASAREELEAVLVPSLAALPTDKAMARLEKAGIGTARVNEMQGVWDHPQLAARRRWENVATPSGAMPALRPVSGANWRPRMEPVPALGEHTESVLREFGLQQPTGT